MAVVFLDFFGGWGGVRGGGGGVISRRVFFVGFCSSYILKFVLQYISCLNDPYIHCL